ncbi:MAG: 50S ribosomal protein L9 [Fimbriimonadaceae bacterium]
MKVILKQTVPKVGKEGEVANVKDGYARNFLFPNGLAILADRKQMKAVQMREAKLATKLEETKADAERTKEKLDGKEVKILAKVGKELGKLFGAITAQDIADKIKEDLGVELEKKQVGLIQPIKKLGKYPIEIDLHRNVDATLTVVVYDPEAPTEEEVKEKEQKMAEEAAKSEAVPTAEITKPVDEEPTEEQKAAEDEARKEEYEDVE